MTEPRHTAVAQGSDGGEHVYPLTKEAPSMIRPDMFIVYVRDVAATADFYRQLFGIEPAFFPSPGFATFDLGGGVQLALWSSHDHALDRESVVEGTRVDSMGSGIG